MVVPAMPVSIMSEEEEEPGRGEADEAEGEAAEVAGCLEAGDGRPLDEWGSAGLDEDRSSGESVSIRLGRSGEGEEEEKGAAGSERKDVIARTSSWDRWQTRLRRSNNWTSKGLQPATTARGWCERANDGRFLCGGSDEFCYVLAMKGGTAVDQPSKPPDRRLIDRRQR